MIFLIFRKLYQGKVGQYNTMEKMEYNTTSRDNWYIPYENESIFMNFSKSFFQFFESFI